MATPDIATLRAMPDGALVPVSWVRELVEGLEGETTDPLGLTVTEVAERTSRAASTVRTWCAEGRLPGARRLRGREWRIPRSALRALLEDDEPGPRASTVKRLETPKGGLAAWRGAS